MHDPRQGLAGTLALLAATVAALFTLALTGNDNRAPLAANAGTERTTLDPEELLELGVERTPTVARRVEAIRELRFDDPPEPEISDVARLRRLTKRELERRRVKRQLEATDAVLHLLGLLDLGTSLGEVATDVSATALAYYDTRRDALVLVGDAAPTGAQLAEFILAHELTHALEDQRFGLPAGGGVSDDRALAETALVEGSATELMIEYARRHLDPLALAEELTTLEGGATGELPRFAEAEIRFSYLGGATFVGDLLELGKDWRLVDHAYERRAPVTTEQVLHPEKYLDDERSLPVRPPLAPGRGWRIVDTGSLGEFGTREVLREGEAGSAGGAAAGWGGDRYRLFRRAGVPPGCGHHCHSTHALAIAWQADDRREARELAAALRTYVLRGLKGVAQGEGIWLLEEGAAAVELAGDRVGLGLAPRPSTARRIASRP